MFRSIKDRPRAHRIGRPKHDDHRRAHHIGEVHAAGIITDHGIALLQPITELREVRLACQILNSRPQENRPPLDQ